MAKTFGTGADPKGLVNRGVEGSGAAQIFRPSQAAQDFVTRQARGEQQKAAQKKAEAKAKVERQKDLDKKFQDLLKIDIKGWTEPDNQRLLAQYGDIEKQAAELKAKGINPFDDNDLTMKITKFQLDMGALQDQKKLFELANTKAYTLATNKSITPEQFTDYEKNIKDWMGLSFEERMIPENLAKLDAPKVVEKVDWMKGIDNLVNNTKLELVQIEDGDVTTTNEKATKENIENRWKLFEKTKEYKAAIEDGVTPQEAKAAFVSNLPSKYRKLYDEESGGVSINYGGGNITSGGIKAIYAPNAYNVFKSKIKGLESIFTQTERTEINPDGAIIFNPAKLAEIPFMMIATEQSGDPIEYRINAIFKNNKNQYVAGGTRRYYTKNGEVRYENKRLIITGQNKEEIEDKYLGGVTIEDAFENFKKERKAKTTTQTSTPKSTAVTTTVKAPSTAPSKATTPLTQGVKVR
jgi:hypothetical protein